MTRSPAKASAEEVICTNRRARHEYTIEETLEAGIVLTGSEVKSLRQRKANLQDSYARVIRGEAMLLNAHVSPYSPASQFNQSPTRPRKLLLHKKEISRIIGKVQQRGLTVIPLRLYFKKGLAKVELAIARGKKLYDKRESLKRKDVEREMARSMRAARSA